MSIKLSELFEAETRPKLSIKIKINEIDNITLLKYFFIIILPKKFCLNNIRYIKNDI